MQIEIIRHYIKMNHMIRNKSQQADIQTDNIQVVIGGITSTPLNSLAIAIPRRKNPTLFTKFL